MHLYSWCNLHKSYMHLGYFCTLIPLNYIKKWGHYLCTSGWWKPILFCCQRSSHSPRAMTRSACCSSMLVMFAWRSAVKGEQLDMRKRIVCEKTPLHVAGDRKRMHNPHRIMVLHIKTPTATAKCKHVWSMSCHLQGYKTQPMGHLNLLVENHLH